MNFKFAEQINTHLEIFDFTTALKTAEGALSKIPTTAFHTVLDQSLNHEVDRLVCWIDHFYKASSKKMAIKALYFEMNEFDINTDTWYIDGFAYDEDGGFDDIEWLCKVTEETITSEEFVLTGYEKLQDAFENIELDTDALQDARDWCEQIIIARFMELMRTAHLKAKENNLQWATIPLYFTEHEYDFILRSKF